VIVYLVIVQGKNVKLRYLINGVALAKRLKKPI